VPTYALYDPKGSPFLIGAARRLNDDDAARDAYARVAERLLGFASPAFTDAADVQAATDAVAMQITFMLAAGVEVFFAKSETRGQRSIAYRDGVMVQPTAKLIADQLNDANGRVISGYDPADWATITSLRTNNPNWDLWDVFRLKDAPIGFR
jgi:hypothetical protein